MVIVHLEKCGKLNVGVDNSYTIRYDYIYHFVRKENCYVDEMSRM